MRGFRLLRIFCVGFALAAMSVVGLPWARGADTVRFFTFGDWGSGKEAQYEVATQVKRVCLNQGCDFGLSLGDNFYPWGVSSVDDPQWTEKFQNVYGSLKVPFYAVLGNHDSQGNVQAQLDYSKKNPLWILPDHQYSFRFPASGPALLEVFVLDSDRYDVKAERWLKGAIAASTATWKLLALHHPILNNGTKHPGDQMKLYPKLKPILCKKIDLILSGHEHIFSHLKDNADSCGWEQVILGTGGARLYGVKSDPPPQYKVFFSEARHGFGYFEVTSEILKFQFIRSDGSIAYRTEWKKAK